MSTLPPGFVLDEKDSKSYSSLPNGFVLEESSSEEASPSLPNEPFSFSGAGRAYGSGLYGGAGGAFKDVANLAEEIPEPLKAIPGFMGIDQVKQLSDAIGMEGTATLTTEANKLLGGEGTPQNAVERILEQAGEFGGMEGFFGTAAGGPVGGGLGIAHGSITGTFYGAFKELGMNDIAALLLAGTLTASPIAARKLIPQLASKSKKFAPSLKKIASNLPDIPPPGAPSRTTSSAKAPSSLSAAEEIEKKAVGRSTSPSERGSFEKAKEILKNLQEESPRPLGPESQPIFPEKDLGGRVTSNGEDLGIRPAPQRSIPNADKFQDTVLERVSPLEVYNKAQGGEGTKGSVLAANDEVYTGVNELYSISRAKNAGIEGIHPELASSLQNRITEIQKIPARGTVSNQIIDKSEDLLKRLTTQDLDGNITGYRPMTNQDLIDQIQEFRQIIDYDFLEGKPKNKFRPVINDIEAAVQQTATSKGGKEAVESFREASNGYRTWSEYFDNDQINPFRKRSNKNYESLFNKSLNKDTFNHLNPILQQSENGQALSKAIQREMVQNDLSEFFKNPRNIDARKFERALRELESVISPEIIEEVKNTFDSYSKRFPHKVRQINFKDTFSKADKAASKLLKLNEEQIISKMNSRSGIKELREGLSKSPTQRKLFQDLKNEKILDMFRGGQVEKKLTGKDLSNVLNKTENYELLTELIGREETEVLRKAAIELGEKEASLMNLKSLGKKLGKNLLKYKALTLLFTVL